MRRSQESEMGFDQDWGKRRTVWRPEVGGRPVRKTSHRVRRLIGPPPLDRRPHLWSYTDVSAFDSEIHRMLFTMTIHWIASTGRIPYTRHPFDVMGRLPRLDTPPLAKRL
jgi:hypothetical protein